MTAQLSKYAISDDLYVMTLKSAFHLIFAYEIKILNFTARN